MVRTKRTKQCLEHACIDEGLCYGIRKKTTILKIDPQQFISLHFYSQKSSQGLHEIEQSLPQSHDDIDR